MLMLSGLGTVHFLRGTGGWWDLGVGHRKKNGLKGGAIQKNKGKRGGGARKIF